jgi:hypothetical protein
MKKSIQEITQRRAARIAGAGYLIIFVLGLATHFFVFGNLIEPGNAELTAGNIINNEMLFRGGLISWLIVLIIDIVIAWALYEFLRSVSQSISLLTAWFRLVYVMIFGITQLNLLFVIILLSGAKFLSVFSTAQVNSLVLLFLNGHNYGFLISLVFFGFHLLLLSYLIYKLESAPKLLAILLLLSGLGYITDSFANFLLPSYDDYKTVFMMIVAIPGIVGELYLTLWLLFKGGKAVHAVSAV